MMKTTKRKPSPKTSVRSLVFLVFAGVGSTILVLLVILSGLVRKLSDRTELVPPVSTVATRPPFFGDPHKLSFSEAISDVSQEDKDVRPYDVPAIQKARQYGARACATVQVVDASDNPIPNANVEAGFFVLDKPTNWRVGKTDENGCFTAVANATWEVRFIVRCEGYYEETRSFYLQDNLSTDSVKDGRWQPWNPTMRIQLKKKGSAAEKFRKTEIWLKLPELGKFFGYDLLAGALVHPFGTGMTEHIRFCLTNDANVASTAGNVFLLVDLPIRDTGLVPYERNLRSGAPDPLSAPRLGYESRWSFGSKRFSTDWKESPEMNMNNGFIFRIGVNSSDCHYGLIRFLDYTYSKQKLSFVYSVNTTTNDPNLEGLYQ